MKIVVSLLSTLALALGMATFVPAAQAAPYPGTVTTSTTSAVPASVKRNRVVPVTFRVRANGSAQPVGQARFQVFRVGAKGKLNLVRSVSRDVSSNRSLRANLNPFRLGSYRVKVSFKPREGSVFKASSASLKSFRVRR